MEAHAHSTIRAEAKHAKREDLDRGRDREAHDTLIDRGGLESEMGSPSTPLTRDTPASRLDYTVEVRLP